MHTQIWAHRGSCHKHIENTLDAFKQAINDGADGIELDVQRTKDGKLIVYHDENLKRLTGVKKYVKDVTWAEIQTMTLSINKHLSRPKLFLDTDIPSLESVLELMKDTSMIINIELKNSIYFYPGMEEEVFACVKKAQMQEQVLYSSFNHLSMHHMASLAGPKHCAILSSDIQYRPWEYAQNINVQSIHPKISSLQNENLVHECHQRGLKVNVWTADSEASIYACLQYGVDAIITNKPEQAIALRKQMQSDGGKKALESIKPAKNYFGLF